MGRGHRGRRPRRGAGRGPQPRRDRRGEPGAAGDRDVIPPTLPRYRQIEQALRERIATLRPGERLPSDAELCREFGVSRMTARNAMQRLAEEGLVTRDPGAAASSRSRRPTAARTA